MARDEPLCDEKTSERGDRTRACGGCRPNWPFTRLFTRNWHSLGTSWGLSGAEGSVEFLWSSVPGKVKLRAASCDLGGVQVKQSNPAETRRWYAAIRFQFVVAAHG